MSNSLESYVGQPVIILSCDGRCFSGTLKGNLNVFDFRKHLEALVEANFFAQFFL